MAIASPGTTEMRLFRTMVTGPYGFKGFALMVTSRGWVRNTRKCEPEYNLDAGKAMTKSRFESIPTCKRYGRAVAGLASARPELAASLLCDLSGRDSAALTKMIRRELVGDWK